MNFSVFDEQETLAKFVRKYENLPMSLADACLVRVAEQHPDAAVLTFDAHFRVYRKNARQVLPVIMP